MYESFFEEQPRTMRDRIVAAFRSFKVAFRFRLIALCGFIVLAIILTKVFLPPVSDNSFPKVIRVPSGLSLRDVAILLHDEGVISSPIVFKDLVILFEGQTGVQAGDYNFDNPESAFFAALKFSRGDGRLAPKKVTVPEGLNAIEIADILETQLHDFDRDTFIEHAAEKQGYLFPDTYYFRQSASVSEIISTMETTFDKKIEPLLPDIEKSGRSLGDIITMASILEKEAWKHSTRQMIAGILWRRISIGMPLQVDAAFLEVNGKTTFDLTHDDLTEDHPYNTYTNKGLPPGPISNPGLDAIAAALDPTPTAYLFYLTDKNDIMRYAETFEEHVQNKLLYLR